jgi:hypothetical protein
MRVQFRQETLDEVSVVMHVGGHANCCNDPFATTPLQPEYEPVWEGRCKGACATAVL